MNKKYQNTSPRNRGNIHHNKNFAGQYFGNSIATPHYIHPPHMIHGIPPPSPVMINNHGENHIDPSITKILPKLTQTVMTNILKEFKSGLVDEITELVLKKIEAKQ